MKKGSVLSTIICIIFLATIYFGENIYYHFYPKGERFGVAFNDQRKKLGILPLPPNWHTDYKDETKDWYSPVRPSQGVFRSSKLVRVEDDHIEFEEDHITNIHNQTTESLTLHYDYDSASHWSYAYAATGLSRTFKLSSEQADSLMKAWDFKK